MLSNLLAYNSNILLFYTRSLNSVRETSEEDRSNYVILLLPFCFYVIFIEDSILNLRIFRKRNSEYWITYVLNWKNGIESHRLLFLFMPFKTFESYYFGLFTIWSIHRFMKYFSDAIIDNYCFPYFAVYYRKQYW